MAHAQALGNRKEFIFQVYVHPTHGDDALAAAQNPVGGTNPSTATALTTHPFNHLNPPIKGRIQHAPYPFRTVTGALGYVNTQFRGLTGQLELPWPLPGDEEHHKIHDIVIHCLPGLYGPGTDIDNRSGLRFNGESFPLSIPHNVSIQGASALDTIFDARHTFTHIFEFLIPLSLTVTHERSFIDSVTVRGCRSEEGPPQGAGIVIRGESKIQCTISNCVITDNDVGIAIDAYPPNPTLWLHSPVIVNDAIAWNRIGIWSGVLKNYSVGQLLGWARPRIYNCVMDSGDPDNQFPGTGGLPNTSCFEGVDPSDLTVSRIGVSPVSIDFNAYDLGRYNVGMAVNPPGWIYPTAPRTSNPTYTPRVNILPLTNTGVLGQQRQALYINDTLRIFEAATSNLASRSPHDFRLTIHPRAVVGDPLILNPLVNQGVDTSAGTLRFANFRNATDTPDIVEEPGLPGPRAQQDGGAADFASFHSGDWDMEGYGNLRTEQRPDFPAPPPKSTYRDLGADEMANGPIIAGAINGTRTFSRDVPGTSGGPRILDNIRVYFFNRYFPGNSYPRPLYTQWTGQIDAQFLGSRHWWNFVQQTPPNITPNPASGSSWYTKGDSSTLRLSQVNQGPWLPFFRSLECDFSPGLLPELHPLWGSWRFGDIFGSNCWYHDNHPGSIVWDNRYFYYDPAGGYAVLYGTINPPASYSWNPTGGYLAGSPVQFGPFGYTGSSTYSVNTWGFGDVAWPDVIPETGNWRGVRFACQVFVAGVPTDNLQTLLGINGVLPVDPPPAGARAPKVDLARLPSKAQMDLLGQLGRAEVRNRLKNQKK